MKVFEYSGYAIKFDNTNLTVSLIPLMKSDAVTHNDENIRQTIAGIERLIEPGLHDYYNIPEEQAHKPGSKVSKGNTLPVLDRLTLNISNLCNMNCQYCYASHGHYYTTGMLMDKNTALAAINYVSRAYSRINRINFFGGEPTLCEPIIDLVCHYCIYLHKKNILPDLPKFGITTNGYDISNKMYKILRAFDFSVSVSLDGPPVIHNRLRRTKTGEPTHNTVAANIKRLLDMGLEPEFECTYTALHYELGIDLVSLMDYYFHEFGCTTLHSPIVTAEPGSPWFLPLDTCLALHTDAIQYSLRNLSREIPKSISVATRLLNCLADRIPICHYCPAGQSTITVNADGNVYACFMLMQDVDDRIGNIFMDTHGIKMSDFTMSLMNECDKMKNSACLECWAQPLCFGCVGDDIRRSKNHIVRSEKPGESEICDYKRSLYEVFLKSLAECYLLLTKKT